MSFCSGISGQQRSLALEDTKSPLGLSASHMYEDYSCSIPDLHRHTSLKILGPMVLLPRHHACNVAENASWTEHAKVGNLLHVAASLRLLSVQLGLRTALSSQAFMNSLNS